MADSVPLAAALSLAHGPAMPNRFMLAPLTNTQSNPDGTLGEDEYTWLTMRAQGGFGLTMTCAAHVQQDGQGFPGQLGIWSDKHLAGLTRLAAGINAAGAPSAVQLQHSGRRARSDLTGLPAVCPWDDAETGARALSTGEVEQVIEDFILAALRAETAGFNGVELHGAHGYLLGQFLDADNNHRDDRYGGSFENRTRVLLEVIAGIRDRAGADFQLGLRLSPERFGITIAEARALAEQVMLSGRIDYLDMSLWDVFKPPIEFAEAGKPLIDYFTDLPRGTTRLGVAGKIMDAARAQRCLDHGADYVLIGRGAIVHHDFPARAIADPGFRATPLPVSRAYLAGEGVGPAFVDYVASGMRGIVAEDAAA
ncbi:NADH:flavin oxidoreductase [Sphingomonas immobilis]|uniref:NADH:flavin oxidoreductase n=1 Tax=Sphingomonas immobilis TaxID=3063997 RepID=A0ABT8ZXD7_9SPHN|nr:NADH:flavin oxidoreductase [Sphingomonas sp. CA1-15]MDO7842235.1 NADH:flavin oxidoreductase [Sphingomonas sp. CA1-15]